MPDLCFYAPWIMKEPIPDPFRMMLEKAGKKRISYDEADCSMRNIRKQGKVSHLHGPTLHALLTLIQIRKEKDSGAAGIQRGRDTINYFCIVCRSLEYARYFPSAEAAEEYVHKYLGFAGMTCYVCHVNWTLASCGSGNMEDNEENLLEENGKILSFANYADVKQYQKQRGMEHSTMAITYASRKKKIILAA